MGHGGSRGRGPDLQHARPLGLRLLGVHGGAAQARDLLHGLAQQVGAQPAVHEHQHRRLEELLVLKNQRRACKTTPGMGFAAGSFPETGRSLAIPRLVNGVEEETGIFCSDEGCL